MIYVYRCPSCDKYAELEFSMFEDRGEPRCAECDAALVRKYTALPVQYKGSGWASGDPKSGLPDIGRKDE